MPLYRNRVWDGKVRLFNAQTKELPCGLLPYVQEFAEKRKYNIDYEDSDYGPPESFNDVDPNEIMTFVKSLDLHNGGQPIEIRDYQFNAICESIKRKRAVMLSPTGSGKSLIIYVLMRWYLENFDEKVLIIVPTTSLVVFFSSAFASSLMNLSKVVKGFNPEEGIKGKIFSLITLRCFNNLAV